MRPPPCRLCPLPSCLPQSAFALCIRSMGVHCVCLPVCFSTFFFLSIFCLPCLPKGCAFSVSLPLCLLLSLFDHIHSFVFIPPSLHTYSVFWLPEEKKKDLIKKVDQNMKFCKAELHGKLLPPFFYKIFLHGVYVSQIWYSFFATVYEGGCGQLSSFDIIIFCHSLLELKTHTWQLLPVCFLRPLRCTVLLLPASKLLAILFSIFFAQDVISRTLSSSQPGSSLLPTFSHSFVHYTELYGPCIRNNV